MGFEQVISSIVHIIRQVLYFLDGYLFYCVLCCMIQKKEGKLVTVFVYISSVYICGMLIYPNDIFNITLALLWFLGLLFLAFRGTSSHKFAVAAVLYPLVIALNFLLSDVGLKLWAGLREGVYVEEILLTADSVIHVLFWYAILKFLQKRIKQVETLFDHKTWMLLGTVCLASMVNITANIYFCPKESYKFWFSALACMATNIGCLFLAEYFTKSIKKDMETKNLKLQKEYYEELEQNQIKIRKFRHDMNNHLSVIKMLFDLDHKEEAEAYFKEISSQIEVNNRVFCKNGIVNAVLNAKYLLAVQNNIDCFFHIDLARAIGIDSVSLCSLFANTLDNAIEASLKIPDAKKRKISVKARTTEEGYFSYEIKNAKINEVRKKKGKFLSDKEDARYHGLGISNISDIVDKYNGMLDITHTAEEFTVTILIKDVS